MALCMFRPFTVTEFVKGIRDALDMETQSQLDPSQKRPINQEYAERQRELLVEQKMFLFTVVRDRFYSTQSICLTKFSRSALCTSTPSGWLSKRSNWPLSTSKTTSSTLSPRRGLLISVYHIQWYPIYLVSSTIPRTTHHS